VKKSVSVGTCCSRFIIISNLLIPLIRITAAAVDDVLLGDLRSNGETYPNPNHGRVSAVQFDCFNPAEVETFPSLLNDFFSYP